MKVEISGSASFATPLTAEHLQIPHRIVSRYASAARDARVDLDELLGEAQLALVKAWRQWDFQKSPHGKAGLGPYLVQRVVWVVRNMIWISPHSTVESARWGRCEFTTLQDRRPDNNQAAIDCLIGREPDPAVTAEIADQFRHLQGLLEELRRRGFLVEREIWVLWQYHLEGWTLRQIGDHLGVGRERVRQLLNRTERILVWRLGDQAGPALVGTPGHRHRSTGRNRPRKQRPRGGETPLLTHTI